MVVEVGQPQKKYSVTVRDEVTGEILYQDESFGGALCQVEQVTKYGMDIEGVHQVACWGHPAVEFYAIDQMKQWLNENFLNLFETMVANGFIKGNVEAIRNMFKKKYDGN